MEVFLSWSKARSRELAALLREWLPEVIQAVRPWMSSEDISKGQRWATEIGARLSHGSQGVICVTSENVGASWLNFEAGALAKSLDMGRVRPLLLDMRPSDVVGPLAQFQATVVRDKDDMYRFAMSLNNECDSPLVEGLLQKMFDRSWSDFLSRIDSIPLSDNETMPAIRRDTEDILLELLERVRDVQRLTPPTGTVIYSSSYVGPDAVGVRRVWDQVLSVVRRSSARGWAVVRESRVVGLDGDALVLSFTHAVHAAMLANNSELLVAALHEVLGVTWRIQTIVEQVPRIDSPASPVDVSPATTASRVDIDALGS